MQSQKSFLKFLFRHYLRLNPPVVRKAVVTMVGAETMEEAKVETVAVEKGVTEATRVRAAAMIAAVKVEAMTEVNGDE